MSELTTKLKSKIPIWMYVPMIVSLLSLAVTLMDTPLASCSPISFLQFKSTSWMAVTVFVLALVFAIQYSLARKAHETKTQEIMALLPHLVCILVLIYIACWLIYMKHSLASCFPEDFSPSNLSLMAGHAFILVLDVALHWWAGYGDFVDAVEFYLPAIEAAVDLRDLMAAAREDYDKHVQLLRDKLGEYRAFYNNVVNSEGFGGDSYQKLTALQETISRSMTELKTMNTTYPCAQQSDKDK
ncbi:hypothetical protein BDP27DRAFT_1446950, partial [Rhodocollybia butyracea]